MTRTASVRGARTHNLKGVDLDLPLGRLIVITGLSGSGKSSLAFDTIHAEGQRRYIETFSPHTRQYLEQMEKPDADSIEGLPPSIAVGQKTGRRSSRSTVGTVTEIHDALGLLFARMGVVRCLQCGNEVRPSDPESVARSIDAFDDKTRYLIAYPLDLASDSDLDTLADSLREEGFTRVRVDGVVETISDGPIPRPTEGGIDVVVDRLVKGSEAESRRLDSIETAFRKGYGRCRIIVEDRIRTFFRDWACSHCGREATPPEPRLFRYNSPLGACPDCEGTGLIVDREAASDPKAVRRTRCPACDGKRLRPASLAVRIDGRDIGDLSRLTISQVSSFLNQLLDTPVAIRILAAALKRLDYLRQIGLDYLTLDRPARTLSGGESRRVALTSALGSGLVNTLYVLDEPSVGLHPRDVEWLIFALKNLRDAGNSVVVVEHEDAVMRAADFLVEIGPGAGESGGHVVYCGPVEGIANVENSPTGRFLSGKADSAIPKTRRSADRGWIELRGATGHNLENVDLRVPLGRVVCVTGVSGAGKSTLIGKTLYPALIRSLRGVSIPAEPYREFAGHPSLADVMLIDQTPIGRSARSNPVTYLKAFDEIRKTFAAQHEAKVRNYGPNRFSFNVTGGRCDRCEGNGELTIDMQFLADVTIRCPECKGTRYRPETLEVTYRGKTIAEVLDLTAREAFGFFRHKPKVQSKLRPLLDVGLDYLRLGQPATTLSGGEAQRLKLAASLDSTPSAITRAATKGKLLYLFDEPTTGLHPLDIDKLLACFDSLADQGHTPLIVEHNPRVWLAADWIIDLGPDAGEQGGRIVAQGTPEDVARSNGFTGGVLAAELASKRSGRG